MVQLHEGFCRTQNSLPNGMQVDILCSCGVWGIYVQSFDNSKFDIFHFYGIESAKILVNALVESLELC